MLRMLETTNSPRPQCLVAEDESIISMMMEIDLDEAGYEIVGPFSSCSEALGWLGQATPDLALIDYKLSDGACVELARELKRRDIPFAVLSGSVEKWVQRRPEFLGVPWLPKPVSEHALKHVLATLSPRPDLQRRNPRQAAPAQALDLSHGR
jgi:two-component system, response regulator PdtaR